MRSNPLVSIGNSRTIIKKIGCKAYIRNAKASTPVIKMAVISSITPATLGNFKLIISKVSM